jgi:hypothetical protein
MLLVVDCIVYLLNLAGLEVGHVDDLNYNGFVVHFVDYVLQYLLPIHLVHEVRHGLHSARQRHVRRLFDQLLLVLQVMTTLTYKVVRLLFHLVDQLHLLPRLGHLVDARFLQLHKRVDVQQLGEHMGLLLRPGELI